VEGGGRRRILLILLSFRHRCIRHGLYDRLWLLVHPVVAARGERLFASAGQVQRLTFMQSKSYRNGVVGLEYSAK